jgi:hypothetical protein
MRYILLAVLVADAVDELIDAITPEMTAKWNASDPRE